MLKMALGRAARSAGEAAVAAMTAAGGCSGRLPARPHPHFPEARSFTPKRRQFRSLPAIVGFYFVLLRKKKEGWRGRGTQGEAFGVGGGGGPGDQGPLHPAWLLILCSGL